MSRFGFIRNITFSLQLLLAFGLAFQLPVVILILGKMGLVGSDQLREKRRHVNGGAFDFGDALNATRSSDTASSRSPFDFIV